MEGGKESEIRADSFDEDDPEESIKLVGITKSSFTDPLVSLGSAPFAANLIMDEENEMSSNLGDSPSIGSDMVESTALKGSGLRKWRRIRRDLNKDERINGNSFQILKRRLPNNDSSKIREESKLKNRTETGSEDSMASMESRNAEISINPVLTGVLPLDLEILANAGFSIGANSDKSEDHSSISSTATSVPLQKLEALASSKDRGRVKNLGGKGSINPGLHKAQQFKGKTADYSKKTKTDLAIFEKENSISSVESDLRSSAAGIGQWGSAFDSNRKLNGRRSSNFDEHSDEAHTGEEIRSGYYKENGKEEHLFKEDMDGDLLGENKQKSENCQSSSDLDPFIQSLAFLQEAQEALENEIQKIAAFGKEQYENNKQWEVNEAHSSHIGQLHPLDSTKTVENSPLRVHSELESLIMEKMEAEIHYMILNRATQNLKILSEDHIALFKEQRHILNLKDVEEKSIELREQKDKLEAYCMELIGTDNALRLQNKVCKYTLSFTVQLMLLSVALGLFFLRLSLDDGVVPT